ncbi:Inactive receptor-like serine/threonine-protein kinase [Hibiscus syriacus]|uniref:Inactive receptor-like serine/threonine-protein kinase n=1 Tax=Hibiscus syriacus TaxID=106335 RepID=A0A6A3B3H4_HIBSY|nr:Inactive receptor-like serine/threonine-protein kinase [Hibiscus syriacus]
MNGRLGFEQLKFKMMVLMLVLSLFEQSFSSPLNNEEGMALLRFKQRVVSDPFGALSNWKEIDGAIYPCSWFGVECSDEKIVNLNLKDLGLVGDLGPEVGQLGNLKSIILRNNSFSGSIPKEIIGLKELEVLDLGFNNFSGLFPSDFGNNLSLTTLLLDNNEFLGSLEPELYDIKMLSGFQVDENQLTDSATIPSCKSSTPTPALQPSVDPPVFISEPPQSHSAPANSPGLTPRQISDENSDSKHRIFLTLVASLGGSLIVLVSVLGIILFGSSKVVSVKPWVTGLSGQLQKAFVTGVPKLKRSELEEACEDFSNIIGSFSDGMVYKGTLSTGVEIAVTSTAIASREEWSKNLETHFRNKIDALSKVNHKNFVNLIGYCEENVPFTRMMVFEYVPNGSLFEHLHIQEAELLDWGMRLRIAMGIAYCLEHMHQLTPPIVHRNLQSCSVYLTEDYAAKISDFSFLNNATAAKVRSATMELLESAPADVESNVYSFGVILFEMITGRTPYSVDNGSLADWASDYLKRGRPLKEMVDPTLKLFQEVDLEKLFEVIKTCVNPDPKERPTMREVAAKLKEITAMGPDGATPKLSPLWWAEIEILSTEPS